MTYLIAIAGASGSGKSTIAAALRSTLSCDRTVAILSMDRYYRDLSNLPEADRADTNFDHPNALDVELMTAHIHSLLADQTVAAPRYDFATHSREATVDTVTPVQVLIVEGLHALYWDAIRNRAHLTIFVDAEANVCLLRRIERDTAERSRDHASIVRQFDEAVLPMFREFIEPTRANANLVVSGFADLRGTVDTIVSHISQETLLP
jgi:uridine kinase